MVAVEGDRDAGRGDLFEARKQTRPRDGPQHREAYAAEIHEVEAAKGGERPGILRLETVPRRRLAPPIGEAPLAASRQR